MQLPSLDDVMVAHLELDLIRHESYDTEALQQVDDDLMKSVLCNPSLLLLDLLRSSDRLMTFEKILAIMVDENVDYL